MPSGRSLKQAFHLAPKRIILREGCRGRPRAASASQGGIEEMEGDQLRCQQPLALIEICVLPPLQLADVVGDEANSSRASGHAAVSLEQVLTDSLSEVTTDPHIGRPAGANRHT